MRRMEDPAAYISDDEIVAAAPLFRRAFPLERLPKPYLLKLADYVHGTAWHARGAAASAALQHAADDDTTTNAKNATSATAALPPQQGGLGETVVARARWALRRLLPKFELVRRLRGHVRAVRTDDKDIFVEGLESLTDAEVRAACAERGLLVEGESGGEEDRDRDGGAAQTRAHSASVLRARLRHWLALSLNREVPSSLLLLAKVMNAR